MLSKTTVRALKFGCVLGVIPALIWAYEFGPPERSTGAPGDAQTACVNSGCHVGTVNSAANGGSVKIVLPGGNTYTPGVKQRIMVQISDANRKSWGFQMTARLGSDLKNGQAGSFSPADSSTQVICDGGGSAPCPSAQPVQFIEHTMAGWGSSVNHPGTYTYQFDWTPPASDAGSVTLYVAGNASNSATTGAPNQNTGHIYTSNVTLTAASAPPGNGPGISAGGVISASAYGSFKSAAPGSFLEVYGTNLGPASDSGGRVWGGPDFVDGNAPTSLDGVTATIGGQSAYVQYVDPGHINVLLPANAPTGAQPFIVTANGSPSAAYSLNINAIQPGLLAPPSFLVNGKQYLVAFHTDGTYVLPAGAIAGLASSPAKPGEIITTYGIGFGPISPGTIPISGKLFAGGTNTLALQFSVSFGGTPAAIPYSGLAPGFTGLYQFNFTIPQISDNDLVPVTFKLNGQDGTQTLFTAVHS